MRAHISARRLPTLRGGIAAGLFCLVTAIALPVAQGGYFPRSWGWSAILPLWIVALWALLSATTDAGRLDIALAGALALLAGWIGLSYLWSTNPAQSLLEVERAIVFLAIVSAFLALVRSSTAATAAVALLTGMTLVSSYALGTRLFPDHLGQIDAFAGSRLAEPIGYWNGLGVFCAVATVLALGLFGALRTSAARALTASSLVVLVPTLYFTFSRGSWITLAIGAAVWLLTTPRRLAAATALAVLAVLPAIAVWRSSRADALTHQSASLAVAEADGRRLALWLLVLFLLQAAVALALAVAGARLNVDRRIRGAYAALLVSACVAGLVVGLVWSGGPVRAVHRTYSAFVAPPPREGRNLNNRLFNLSGNGRAQLWRVAWDVHSAHPWLGAGSGSFERFWDRDRRATFKARDAHNLYLETLAELGPVGLALLIVVLATPAVAIFRRRTPLAAGAFGAYAAYLVHAGADWDWELAGVTTCALLCGAIVVVSARSPHERTLPAVPRAAGAFAALVIAAAAFGGWIGNSAISRAENARDAGRAVEAEQRALDARAWMPWSPRPWLVVGEARLLQGDAPGARSALHRALRLDSRSWQAWLDLAAATAGRERARAFRRAAALNRVEPAVPDFKARYLRPARAGR